MFFREFLRHPLRTGAVAASSHGLADCLTDGIGLGDASLVVELGPGTGAVTDALLARMRPGAHLVAIEVNPHLAAGLRGRLARRAALVAAGAGAALPDARVDVDVVDGSAADLSRLVPSGGVDAVVSGLPWAVMPVGVRREILDAVTGALTPGGWMTTFAYGHAAWMPTARRFADELSDAFGTVERTRTVWRNLPPAFVYRAKTA
ncbi:class I SAM-dependent methyltransferase [Embleya sp. NPDC127516]|uniref:class I SAM-dependent methyltransferase n=1 Tax=Embleya sp. NPDC127516 TaxID=3363990 RepID=UPI0037FB4E8F